MELTVYKFSCASITRSIVQILYSSLEYWKKKQWHQNMLRRRKSIKKHSYISKGIFDVLTFWGFVWNTPNLTGWWRSMVLWPLARLQDFSRCEEVSDGSIKTTRYSGMAAVYGVVAPDVSSSSRKSWSSSGHNSSFLQIQWEHKLAEVLRE